MVDTPRKQGKVAAQSTGRMKKARTDQYAANQKIVNRLQTQANVQSLKAGGADAAKKEGMKAAVPSPAYWGGKKGATTAKEDAANAAFARYKHLAKKGK